jgi:DedD protein
VFPYNPRLMDETLKARLIGASILVVLAVILVPELLSGRKQAATVAGGGDARGTRTYTIDLGGAVAAGSRLPADSTPAPATLPEVKSATPATTDVAPDPAAPDEGAPVTASPDLPAPSLAPPAPTPAPATRPLSDEVKPAAAAAKGGLAVQVGAFGSAATARKLVDDLKGDGYSAYVAPLAKGGKTLYRVRVGPVADRAAADKLAAQLKGRKLPATVVSGA